MRKTNLLIIVLFLPLVLILAGALGVVSLFSFISLFQSDSNDSDIAINVELENVVKNNDIFNASLLLARKYCPDIDIEQANRNFDDMTNEIKEQIIGIDNPKEVIKVIGDYLFVENQRYPDDATILSRLFPRVALEGKKGHCVEFSLLYLALGERLHLPVYAKKVPSHMYVCYDDGFKTFNIETTMKGNEFPDSYYFNRLHCPERHQTINILSKQEVLGLFLDNLSDSLKQRQNVLDIQKNALLLYPDSVEIHTNTGNILQKLNKPKVAKKHFLKAIDLDSTSWQAYFGISNLYYDMGDYKQAAAYYTQTVNLLPKSVKILSFCQIGMPEKEKLIELADEMLQSGEVPYDNLIAFGVALFQQEEYKLSNELFAQALKIYPEKLGTHAFYAMASFHLGNYELARKHTQIAEKCGEQDTDVNLMYFIDKMADCHMRLGQCHAILKKYELALRETNKAIEIGGPKHQFFCSMAVTYQLMEDKAEAIKYYKKALSLDPSNVMIQEKISSLQSNKEDIQK